MIVNSTTVRSWKCPYYIGCILWIFLWFWLQRGIARLDVFLNYNNTLNLALLVKFFNLQLPYSNDNCMKTTLRLFKFPAKKACQHHWRSSILKGEMRWRNHSKRCRSDYRDDLPWTLLRVYKFILASMYKVSNLRR